MAQAKGCRGQSWRQGARGRQHKEEEQGKHEQAEEAEEAQDPVPRQGQCPSWKEQAGCGQAQGQAKQHAEEARRNWPRRQSGEATRSGVGKPELLLLVRSGHGDRDVLAGDPVVRPNLKWLHGWVGGWNCIGARKLEGRAH